MTKLRNKKTGEIFETAKFNYPVDVWILDKTTKNGHDVLLFHSIDEMNETLEVINE